MSGMVWRLRRSDTTRMLRHAGVEIDTYWFGAAIYDSFAFGRKHRFEQMVTQFADGVRRL